MESAVTPPAGGTKRSRRPRSALAPPSQLSPRAHRRPTRRESAGRETRPDPQRIAQGFGHAPLRKRGAGRWRAPTVRLDKRTSELLDRYLRERGARTQPLALTRCATTAPTSSTSSTRCRLASRPPAGSRTDLRRYLAVLLGEGVADGSVARKVSTIRSFYKWLRSEELLDNDPFFGVAGPKAAQAPARRPRARPTSTA